MKRLLALIENNAQANALQRETTMNILLRLELIEQNVKMLSRDTSAERAGNLSRKSPTQMSRHMIGGESQVGDSQNNDDYMKLVGKRRQNGTSSARNRSP
jgi:hypothetical protein